MLIRAAKEETLSIAKDYELLIDVLEDRGKGKKIYPNDPCPCRSGKSIKNVVKKISDMSKYKRGKNGDKKLIR